MSLLSKYINRQLAAYQSELVQNSLSGGGEHVPSDPWLAS